MCIEFGHNYIIKYCYPDFKNVHYDEIVLLVHYIIVEAIKSWSQATDWKCLVRSVNKTVLEPENNLPEAGGRPPTMSQGSASGTHRERLELCSPLNNTVPVHLHS